MENWRPVVGFEGTHEVSDLGRVRSSDRVIMRSNGRQQRLHGKVLVGSVMPSGHIRVALRHGHRSLLHRLVLEAFVGPCPPGLEGCHNSGDPSDNRLSNLRWDTRSENIRDSVRHGTHALARRSHCPRRHRLEGKNLTTEKGRACRSCSHARTTARRALARNGEVLDIVELSNRYYEAIKEVD